MSDNISQLISTEQHQRELMSNDALETLAGFSDTSMYLASIPRMISVNLLKAYPMPSDVWQLQQTNGYRIKCRACNTRLIDRMGANLDCGHLALVQSSNCGAWTHMRCRSSADKCQFCTKPNCTQQSTCFWC